MRFLVTEMNSAESRHMPHRDPTRYDLIIAGAGMVGVTFALACALVGLKVVIIDSQVAEAELPDGYDLRVSAITLASRAIFRNLGMWGNLERRRVCPFREMDVWDPRGFGTVHFDAAEIGEAELGYIIENRAIVHAAQTRLTGFPSVRFVCPAELSAVAFDHTGVAATVSTGEVLTASLVVGADGARSRVRELAGIQSRGGSYDQIAIVATVRTSVPHGETARQAFLASGPLAILPLCDPRLSSIVWSCDSGYGNDLMGLEEAAFCSELQKRFDGRLGETRLVGARAAFPLTFAHAERYVDPRLALIGDAAHCVHPLAGQGVNLGLLDAAALADVVATAFRSGLDIGSYAVLRRYERWRRGDNLMMLGVTDTFKRAFGVDYGPLRVARNIGLLAADVLGPLRRLVMRRAVGLEGDLPPLARGRGAQG